MKSRKCGATCRSPREALFRTVLAVSPPMLLCGVGQAHFAAGPALMAVDVAVGLAFCAPWTISLFEAGKGPAG